MQKEAIFQILSEKVTFQGIAVRDFKEGIFCGLVDIAGVPYILDDIHYSDIERQMWDVTKAKLYHYTLPSEDGDENHVCPFCDYQYEEGRPLTHDLMCLKLNENPYLSAIWGSAIFSPTFEKTFNELMRQLNPKGIKSEN